MESFLCTVIPDKKLPDKQIICFAESLQEGKNSYAENHLIKRMLSPHRKTLICFPFELTSFHCLIVETSQYIP